MNELEWFNTVACKCEKAKTVRGGSMCYYYDKKNYCEFNRCPKVKHVL